ncbi:uncharacterized protein NPIL_393001 [Nephila pilipes]|uniref:Uncharacterized protein n=1 Tax=Nephila pilipes TaxID=299642 RepID=A0A8X6QLJ8_NEPPI|nr:uncharacterized protein NPIL_393001 [Nephila pilipes]
MTKTILVKVNRLERSSSSGIVLQYLIFPIDSIRMFVNCVHYKKLTVETTCNKIYSLMLAPVDLAHSDLEEAWDLWTKATTCLQRAATDIKDSEKIKGFFNLDNGLPDPFFVSSLGSAF